MIRMSRGVHASSLPDFLCCYGVLVPQLSTQLPHVGTPGLQMGANMCMQPHTSAYWSFPSVQQASDNYQIKLCQASLLQQQTNCDTSIIAYK